MSIEISDKDWDLLLEHGVPKPIVGMVERGLIEMARDRAASASENEVRQAYYDSLIENRLNDMACVLDEISDALSYGDEKLERALLAWISLLKI